MKHIENNNSSSAFEAFLEVADHFNLGMLPTECPHPKTMQLSNWANTDLSRAIAVLKEIDLEAIDVVIQHLSAISAMSETIGDVLRKGNRIFLCGCGATGRLSLTLETLWRQLVQNKEIRAEWSERVLSFTAGADYALVHSIENFEDYPEYGATQLRELGFSNNDMLIACTEGGETPFVIGATEEAARLSSVKPFFLYCNPDALLRKVARSKVIIENDKIEKINLTCGPMSLAGSTRLQASTVLMFAVGIALFSLCKSRSMAPCTIAATAKAFKEKLQNVDFHFLEPFIQYESALYKNRQALLYETNEYGITILTDTTERSPTFSLSPFENFNNPCSAQEISWCYLMISQSQSAEQAWQTLLQRNPRVIQWQQFEHKMGLAALHGFDFSRNVLNKRQSNHIFRILKNKDCIEMTLGDCHHIENVTGFHLLEEHILLKLILNIHSLLIMGRVGRYEGNIMTWVQPNNNKLIDRAARYVQWLLKEKGVKSTANYESIVKEIFIRKESTQETDPIVLQVVKALSKC